MHRWFYANEELICELKKSATEEEQRQPQPVEPQKYRRWRFCVKIDRDRELLPNEAIALTGNCDELGNWEFLCSIVMTPISPDKADVWEVYLDIPEDREVTYRYLIVAMDPVCDQMIVRFFESHLETRKIKANAEMVVDVCDDIFGLVNDIKKVERGWVTTERIVQFKFFKEPFTWHSPTWSKASFYVKVIPFFRKNLQECLIDAGFYEQSSEKSIVDMANDAQVDQEDKNDTMMWAKLCKNPNPSYTKLHFDESEHSMSIQCESGFDESNGEEGSDIANDNKKKIRLSTAFSFCEVANTRLGISDLTFQPRFGVKCGKEDLITTHMTIGDFDNTVYLIELYKYSRYASDDELPYRVGYRYILPEDFKTFKHGFMEAPIVCASKHRAIGSMKFGFTIIHPHPTLTFDLSVSYLRHLSTRKESLFIGHRGQGATFYSSEHSMIYENTIYSMREAIQSGVDMVEFDIHLTKDLVPIIYHDFTVHVARHNNTLLQNFDNVDIPVSKYSYEALQNLKITQSNEENPQLKIGDAHKRLQLFPKLSDAFDMIEENIGFDIEVKWPQQLCDHTYEEGVHPFIDRNQYIDQILDVVFSFANSRRIIFSSFDADICTHLRFKQNRYPVMLITRKEIRSPLLDPRVRTPTVAANFAYTMELMGVVTHADILNNYALLIAHALASNLVTFAYGIEEYDDIPDLKIAGIRGIIVDRMDEFKRLTSEVKDIKGVGGGGGGGGGGSGDRL